MTVEAGEIHSDLAKPSGLKVAAVVVHYGSIVQLNSCLASLRNSAQKVACVVVDNSPHSSTRELRDSWPEVEFVYPKRNLGFGAGVNFGIARVSERSDVILVLNPDVRVGEDCISRLSRALGETDVAIAAPRLIAVDGRVQKSARRFPSPIADICRRTPLGHTRFGRRVLERYLGPATELDRVGSVDWVVGACMLVDRAAGDALGWFDERFFLYFEDVDLCARAWSAGYRVVLDPAAVARHVHVRASAGKFRLSAFQRYHITSAAKFYLKHPRFIWAH